MRAVLVDAPQSLLDDRRRLGLDKLDVRSSDDESYAKLPLPRNISRARRSLRDHRFATPNRMGRRIGQGVRSGRRLSVCLGAVLLVVGACGGEAEPEAAPVTDVSLSPECQQAFVDGHNLEAEGQPTNQAFLSSVESCATLEEWTAAAAEFGVDLRGQEATFVDGVCAAGDDALRSQAICEQALERFRTGR